jgi:hypothetical protein
MAQAEVLSMRQSPTLFPVILLLVFLGGIHATQGD